MTFPCTKCGACCRRAVYAVTSLGLTEWSPGFAKDGSCGALQADNTCAIYETRPLLCRIDDMRIAAGEEDEAAWHEANARHCNEWQAEDGLPDTYRIRLPVVEAHR